ncbi:MAG: hypothetical protein V4487_00185, partial [Chlamydiota bacterium]
MIHEDLREEPLLKKDSAILINDVFKHPKTNLLIYHFEPHPFKSPELRMKDCTIECTSVSGKEIYVFDNFFQDEEAKELRQFSKTASFSKGVFGDYEEGEGRRQYANAMDSKERWLFFSKPPQTMKEIFKFLSFLSLKLNAQISTLPWELCHETTSFTAVSTNFVKEVPPGSMNVGKHWDYKPEEGLAFGIPVLHAKEKSYHIGNFTNGAAGKPWMVSLILYSAAENFQPEYGMGTVFFKDETEIGFRTDCKDARLILFEGDLLHSLEESRLPAG